MTDDNTRADAERLERIRKNFHAQTKWDTQYDRDVHFLLAQLDIRDAALRDARAKEREACAQIADLYAENPPSGDDNNTQAAFDLGMDHMAGCVDAAIFIAEAIRDPARLTAVPDPRSISDAAAERAKIVAWLWLEADLCNPEYRVILHSLARAIERGDYAQPESAQEPCGECDYDPDHLYHDCRDNPGTTPEPVRREDEGD